MKGTTLISRELLMCTAPVVVGRNETPISTVEAWGAPMRAPVAPPRHQGVPTAVAVAVVEKAISGWWQAQSALVVMVVRVSS